MKLNEPVTINWPSHPFHGKSGRVVEVTDYGGRVQVADRIVRVLPDEVQTVAKKPSAREQGFTGNICKNCLGSRMIVAGKCEQCLDCYASGECA